PPCSQVEDKRLPAPAGDNQATMAWPPACSILALADSENLAAVTLRERVSSPLPRTLTLVSPERIRPAAASAVASIAETSSARRARSPTLMMAISVRKLA